MRKTFDIVKKSEVKKTFRVDKIKGTYALDADEIIEHFSGSLDLPEKWNVGLIVGASGTGKSTILKNLYGDDIMSFTPKGGAVVDDMPEGVTVDQIIKAFSAVGFSSVPSWLKPYNVLSNGEKMRVEMAYGLLSGRDSFAFDEFTSVVDRTVAKTCSYVIQKAVRKADKKFIACACHYDIKDWLLPDWVFDTNTMTFSLCSKKKDQDSTSKFGRPQKVLNIGKCLGDIII